METIKPSDTPLTDEVIRQGGTLFINLSEHARSLERSLAAAREALQEAMDYIADGQEGIPKHDCEFVTHPKRGMCAFHEWWAKLLAPQEGER